MAKWRTESEEWTVVVTYADFPDHPKEFAEGWRSTDEAQLFADQLTPHPDVIHVEMRKVMTFVRVVKS